MPGSFDPNGRAGPRPDYARTPLEGRLVAVMRLELADRGLLLAPYVTRCLRRHDIHELIVTAEDGLPGSRIATVGYIGFVELTSGGVVIAGDAVHVGDAEIGLVLGFDETHLPNHMNIVLRGGEAASGARRGLALGDQVTFRPVFSR